MFRLKKLHRQITFENNNLDTIRCNNLYAAKIANFDFEIDIHES